MSGKRICHSTIQPIPRLVAVGANVNSAGDGGFTPLIWAATKGYPGSIKQLVIAGADINKGDADGSTPLMFATKHGFAGCVGELLKAGASVDHKDAFGYSAIYLAIMNDHSYLVPVLIQAGADPNSVVNDRPLLLWAAAYSYQSVIALVNAGARSLT